MTHLLRLTLSWIAFFVLAAATVAPAQSLSPDQLDLLVAPIALFPDDLLSQVLMASAYPLEVVEADRWQQSNPNLTESERERRLRSRTWDPSVTSLTAFPDVLHQMSLNLEWTETLGEAFIANQAAVLDAVQRMRDRAVGAGTLQSTPQETVTVSDGCVTIAPTNPEVIYVPVYSPYTAYGPWTPPYGYYYPSWVGLWSPGSYFTGNLISFGLGVLAGDWMFGRCNWQARRVWIEPRCYGWAGYRGALPYSNLALGGAGGRPVNWQYNGFHRGGVNFRTPVLQQRFGNQTGLSGLHRNVLRGFGPGRQMQTPTFARPVAPQVSAPSAAGPRGSFRPSVFGGYSLPAVQNRASVWGAQSRGVPGGGFNAVPPGAPARPAFGRAPGGARGIGGGRHR